MLTDLSPMLASLITGLIRGPQIEVIDGPQVDVTDGTARGRMQALVAETGATVVIMPGEGAELSEAGRRLLDDRARLRVVALSDHADAGVVGALTVRTVEIQSLSKASLLDAIAGDLDGDASVLEAGSSGSLT